jgi:sugar/nucleoside kinase (ribokinase family)
VGTAAVAVRAGVPTGMTVALSHGPDRAILTALGAMTSLTARDVPAALLARARHVHVSSYFLLERSLGPGLAAVLADARAAGATTSLDTNWDPAGKWGGGQLRASLVQTDVLLPNGIEATRIAGEPTVRPAARALTAMGPRVAVKLGERGVLCADGPVWHRVELPPVTPVDTTGAGDCFNAGLITGLLRGLDLPGAAALGCAVGALSTRAAGGTASCPDLASALALAQTATVRRVGADPPSP